MEAQDIVSWIATVCTIGVSLVGLEICAKIARKGSPGDISFIPFLIMFIRCFTSNLGDSVWIPEFDMKHLKKDILVETFACLWLKYGLLRKIYSIVFVNSVAAFLQSVYMCIYYLYSLQRAHLHRMLIIGLLLLFIPLVYIKYYVPDDSSAINLLGTICCCITVISYGSPLASVAHVIKTKSTECMSFPLTSANFIVSLEWLFYGSLLKDVYVQMPNMFGALLCLIQFALFFKYPAKPRPITSIAT